MQKKDYIRCTLAFSMFPEGTQNCCNANHDSSVLRGDLLEYRKQVGARYLKKSSNHEK